MLLLDATMFWNPTGGVRRYIGAKGRWLQRHTTWRHAVATPMAGAHERGIVAVPSAPLPGSGGAYRLPWHRGACARVLAAPRPDLIESADPYRLAWASLDAARALGIPAVGFCHSNLEQMGGLLAGRAGRALARRYAAHLYGRFDLVLAPSRAMVTHLHDWGVAGARHQPLGVDTSIFRPDRRDAGLHARLGVAPDTRLLVFAGRFAPEKRLQTLADAVDRLGDGYRLVAIGNGPVPPRGKRVIILPPVDSAVRLAALIAGCDLFVHAGEQETFGLSVLEAMACGLPVVARAAEGLAELVDSSVGCGVANAHAASFADAIDGVFATGLQRLGAEARSRAEGHSWERVLPLLWDRYRSLLGSATPVDGTLQQVVA